jgi:6-phosphogluconolactonase
VATFEAEWRAHNLDNLDVVILGIGDDGHTASLFPGTPALDVEDRIATSVFVEKLAMWRVTITKPVIRNAKLRIVLATGASKRDVLTTVRDGAMELPIAQCTQGVETWWFVDRAAAPS